MKRATAVISLSCILCFSVVGCGRAPSGGPAKAVDTTPAASAPAKQEPAAGTDGKITQEEAGIKVRVDMPEIKTFLQQTKQGPVIPALKQKAVPQGIGFIEEKKWILVSHYREDGKPSLLTVLNAETGKLVKAMELYRDAAKPYTGHAGGVTVSKKHVWISSDNDVYRIPLEDVLKSENDSKLVFNGSIHTETRASFTAYDDGILWVGEFADGKNYPTEKSHYMLNRDGLQHKAWTVGYKLDPQSDLLPTDKVAQANTTVTPDYILSIPDTIQGMAIRADKIVLSQSFGRNSPSTLTQYKNILAEKPHATATIGSDSVPVWFIDSKNKLDSLRIPPMSEGVVPVKDTLYILFESGATPYMASSSYALDRIQLLPFK